MLKRAFALALARNDGSLLSLSIPSWPPRAGCCVHRCGGCAARSERSVQGAAAGSGILQAELRDAERLVLIETERVNHSAGAFAECECVRGWTGPDCSAKSDTALDEMVATDATRRIALETLARRASQ